MSEKLYPPIDPQEELTTNEVSIEYRNGEFITDLNIGPAIPGLANNYRPMLYNNSRFNFDNLSLKSSDPRITISDAPATLLSGHKKRISLSINLEGLTEKDVGLGYEWSLEIKAGIWLARRYRVR